MKISRIVSSLLFFSIVGNSCLSAQNLTFNANLLETNFSADSNPTHMNFISGNKLIFNAKFGVTIKDSENGRSKLLIKISSEYKNYVNEDNTYSYDASKALNIFIIDNKAYFFIEKNSKLSLWRTDGTDAGTKFIKEFPNPNFMTSDFVISSFTKFNNKLIFSIYHMYGSPSRSELWVSDETPAGTELVSTLNNNSTLSSDNYVNINNKVYFTNYNSNSEKKIWKSDGTVNNTIPVLTGAQDDYLVAGNMIDFNGYLYFIKVKNNIAYLSYYNTLTNEITDVFTLPSNINPYNSNGNLYLVNNSLVFANNNKLWKSDGTAAGTLSINSSAYPNYGNSGINNIFVFKNKLYFDAFLPNYGYAMLTYNNFDITKLSDSFPELEYAILMKKSKSNFGDNNYLIFATNSTNDYVAFNGTSLKLVQNLIYDYDSGYEMSVTDTPDNNFIINAGSEKYGQELFKFNFANGQSSLYENANSTSYSYFIAPQVLNGKLFYFGTDEFGTGPMVTDGTEIGTSRIKNDVNTGFINHPVVGGEYIPTIQLNNKVYFPCSISGALNSLCVTDGTTAETKMIKNVNPMGEDGSSYDDFPAFVRVGNTDKFLFKVDENSFITKQWISDGTEAGTSILNIPPVYRDNYALLGNKTFYTANDYNQNKRVLMVTDGNQSGTHEFYTFTGTKRYSSIIDYSNDKFFFLVIDQIDYWTSKSEIWVSDGTIAGTSMVKSMDNPFSTVAAFSANAKVYNGKLYFFALSGNSSNGYTYNPYISDGTINGTYKLTNNEFIVTSPLTACGNNIYFSSRPDSNGFRSVWAYNNNQFNMLYTNNQNSISNFLSARSVTCVNNNLYFLSREYQENKIIVTNGTQNGTKQIDINANGILSDNTIINMPISSLNTKLYFNAPFKDSNNFNFFGNELYVMDVSQVTLGTNEISNSHNKIELSILVFPNPAISEINLAATKDDYIKNVEVYNMGGNMIINKKQINNSKTTIDLNNILNGVYLLKIQTEKGSFVKKIIKK
ncbi:T9SS type A sorting domain-containing protein [Chryseobacterium sp. MMS23-Vi53]|uniref:T9SS type A sorting domain-containing protein n=1 Tax=Chryseobacterium sp. MMS23-Vi53 TaxID=3386644 RepID=UPI0039EC0B24